MEKIQMAAILFDDGLTYEHQVFQYKVKTGYVLCGYRHHLIIETVHIHGKTYFDKSSKKIQGFVTSKGRFVDRLEAAKIAFKAKQILEPKEILYSEDLW